jgi:predicted GNAT family N-acyltransferase
VDLVDWRMEKKQHMRWTRRGAQMLLHARCALLNAELGKYTRGSQAVHVKPVATRRAEGGAEVQDSLGRALTERAKRTKGEGGTELVVQAVTILKSALEVTTREFSPKGWALNQNDLGVALTEQAIRSDGAKAVVLLGQAVAAYRSALEVRTREQLPQDWAETQNNLGRALSDQAARTEGAKGAKLLAQAVTVLRSCLEIYTAEAFPFYHERAEEQLKECERLLTQAKPKAQ